MCARQCCQPTVQNVCSPYRTGGLGVLSRRSVRVIATNLGLIDCLVAWAHTSQITPSVYYKDRAWRNTVDVRMSWCKVSVAFVQF